MPATLSIITNVFPREERGKAIGDLVRRWPRSASASARCSAASCSSGSPGRPCSWSTCRSRPPPCSQARARPREPRPAPGRFRPRRRRTLDRALARSSTAIIEAPGARLDGPAYPRQLRGRRAADRASSAGSCSAAEPMLNLSFFRNPRFSVGSAADRHRVLLALRLDLRDHAVPAGRARLQRTAGRGRDDAARVRSRDRRRLEHLAGARLGTTRVVTGGLVGMAAVLATTLAWTPEMSHSMLGLWFFGLALSIGWTWRRRPLRSWAPCPRRRPASPRR